MDRRLIIKQLEKLVMESGPKNMEQHEDAELAFDKANELLLEYIGDTKITSLYNKIRKQYNE